MFLHAPYNCFPLLTLAYFHNSHCNVRTLPPSPLGTPQLILHIPSPPHHTHTHKHTQTFRTAINKVNLHCKLADGFGICIAACCLLPLAPPPAPSNDASYAPCPMPRATQPTQACCLILQPAACRCCCLSLFMHVNCKSL